MDKEYKIALSLIGTCEPKLRRIAVDGDKTEKGVASVLLVAYTRLGYHPKC